MKKVLPVIASFLIAQIGFAQITLTSADIGQAGDSMIVGNNSPAAVLSVGGTGSQTWTYNFPVDNFNVLLFQDPLNTASGASFPTADMAIERLNDTSFFKLNSSVFAVDGISGNLSSQLGVPISIALDIAGDVTQLEVPTDYQDAFTDFAMVDTTINCADINAATYCSQARIKRIFIIDSEIDAYGSLETPGGTYPNTLRQYYKERTIDSIWANLPVFGGPLTFFTDIDSTSHQYRWFANVEKWPVLSVYADAQGGNINTAEFQIDNLLATIVNKSNPACQGDCNGSVTVLGLGADPPYTYTWPASANNQTGPTATGLCAGTYMVTIKDVDTTTHVLEVVLNDPTLVAISGSVKALNFLNDGAIDITPSGGTAPYSYTWTGPNGFTATTQDVNTLDSGIYTVVVTDSKGCTSTKEYTVVYVFTGINDVSAAGFSIYPNPSKGQVTIESKSGQNRVRISDLLGNVVFSSSLLGSKNNLDLSQLSGGVYMIELATVSGINFQKLTLQK